MLAERILMTLLLGGIAIGCTLVLYPFFSAILWAAILTYTTWPLFEWLRDRLRLGHTAASAAMVAGFAVLVVLPLALAAPGGANDIAQIRREAEAAIAAGLPGAPTWVGAIPLVGDGIAERWNHVAADLSSMVAFARPYFGIVGEYLLSILLGLANGVLLFVLALFVAFFFFASGEPMAAHIVAVLRRIAGAQADRLIAVTGATIRGVVYGILGTALVQGLLTALGLWASGVPRPLLLGVIAGGLSVLPVGAPVIWIPAGLWLMSTGHTAWGAALLIYGTVAIS
jgi:predicted PurR-regulated permease PerM